jgi:hypothetical protein
MSARYRKGEEANERAVAILKEEKRVESETGWYEKANRQLPNVKDLERAAEVMERDLHTFAEQLVKARRERVRELYAAELAGWQAELAAKGLTIDLRN